jgi:hypothetical protein
MFGDIDYDPSASYAAVPFEEQLMALGRAVEAGKVSKWMLGSCLKLEVMLSGCHI